MYFFSFRSLSVLMCKIYKDVRATAQEGCYIHYEREVISEDVVIPPREWLETLHVHATRFPPRSSPSEVVSFVVGSLVCLAVCVFASWIGGEVIFGLAMSSSWPVRSWGRNDNGGGNDWKHTKHRQLCLGPWPYRSALSRCGWARYGIV